MLGADSTHAGSELDPISQTASRAIQIETSKAWVETADLLRTVNNALRSLLVVFALGLEVTWITALYIGAIKLYNWIT